MSRDRVVLVKGRAGLGNRMLSAVNGVLYASLSGRRLVVDWTDRSYTNDGDNGFHRLFDCPAASHEPVADTESIAPACWAGNLDRTAIDMSRRTDGPTSIDPGRMDYDEEVVVLWTYHQKIHDMKPHFRGPWEKLRHVRALEITRRILVENFLPQAAIRERVEAFRRQHLTQPSVGVHVRYTDHRGALLATLRALDRLLARSPELVVFLGTDNDRIVRLFEKVHPGVVTAPRWYAPPGMPIHRRSQPPDRAESTAQALVDLLLLAGCDHLIGDASSSFYYVAERMARNAESAVDVRRRGKRRPEVRDRLWKAMLRLGLYRWGLDALGTALGLRKRAARALARRA